VSFDVTRMLPENNRADVLRDACEFTAWRWTFVGWIS